MSFCLYNKKNITRRFEDISLVRKILFCHSKIKFISSRQRVISSLYINVYKFYKCAMHFPSLCAFSWWFHTVTEMSFILVGPGMPFSFHQSQYRLLIVTDSISLSIWSLNLKQISFKISEKPSCHLLLPSKLPQQHLSQDSPENYNSEPTLLDRTRAFP